MKNKYECIASLTIKTDLWFKFFHFIHLFLSLFIAINCWMQQNITATIMEL